MSKEQLMRLDNINHYSQILYPQVQYVDYSRFAILTDPEREEFLVFMENKIKNVRKEKMAILNN